MKGSEGEQENTWLGSPGLGRCEEEIGAVLLHVLTRGLSALPCVRHQKHVWK